MGISIRKLVSIITSLAFLITANGDLFSGPAFAKEEHFIPQVYDSVSANAPDIGNGVFSMPKYLGTVVDEFRVSNSTDTGASSGMVVHIQDAHCNYAAQLKISEILGFLDERYQIETINLEGGEGAYDLSPFKEIADLEIRTQVADHFMREGMINGAEYFEVIRGGGSRLWGVESKDLYLENLDIYRNSLQYRDDVESVLSMLRTLLDGMKTEIYSKDHLEFDSRYESYKRAETGFKEYLLYMVDTAENIGIPTEDLENIQALCRLAREEGNIDFRKANTEREVLIKTLQKKMPSSRFSRLASRTLESKTGRLSLSEFYAYLLDDAKAMGIDADNDYNQLFRYIGYISGYESLDKSRMMEEVDELEEMITRSLSRDQNERELAELSKSLTLMSNMLNFTLTRNDYRYFEKSPEKFQMIRFFDFIEKRRPIFDPKMDLAVSVKDVDDHLKKVSRFFECSFRRDEAFLSNMKGAGSHGRINVIITGGFHSENLCGLLKEKNTCYVSVMPDFKNPENIDNPYFDILSGDSRGFIKQISSSLSAIQVPSIWNSLGAEVNGETPGLNSLGVQILAEMIRSGEGIIFRLSSDDKKGWVVFEMRDGSPRCYFTSERPEGVKAKVITGEAGDASDMAGLLRREISGETETADAKDSGDEAIGGDIASGTDKGSSVPMGLSGPGSWIADEDYIENTAWWMEGIMSFLAGFVTSAVLAASCVIPLSSVPIVFSAVSAGVFLIPHLSFNYRNLFFREHISGSSGRLIVLAITAGTLGAGWILGFNLMLLVYFGASIPPAVLFMNLIPAALAPLALTFFHRHINTRYLKNKTDRESKIKSLIDELIAVADSQGDETAEILIDRIISYGKQAVPLLLDALDELNSETSNRWGLYGEARTSAYLLLDMCVYRISMRGGVFNMSAAERFNFQFGNFIEALEKENMANSKSLAENLMEAVKTPEPSVKARVINEKLDMLNGMMENYLNDGDRDFIDTYKMSLCANLASYIAEKNPRALGRDRVLNNVSKIAEYLVKKGDTGIERLALLPLSDLLRSGGWVDIPESAVYSLAYGFADRSMVEKSYAGAVSETLESLEGEFYGIFIGAMKNQRGLINDGEDGKQRSEVLSRLIAKSGDKAVPAIIEGIVSMAKPELVSLDERGVEALSGLLSSLELIGGVAALNGLLDGLLSLHTVKGDAGNTMKVIMYGCLEKLITKASERGMDDDEDMFTLKAARELWRSALDPDNITNFNEESISALSSLIALCARGSVDVVYGDIESLDPGRKYPENLLRLMSSTVGHMGLSAVPAVYGALKERLGRAEDERAMDSAEARLYQMVHVRGLMAALSGDGVPGQLSTEIDSSLGLDVSEVLSDCVLMNGCILSYSAISQGEELKGELPVNIGPELRSILESIEIGQFQNSGRLAREIIKAFKNDDGLGKKYGRIFGDESPGYYSDILSFFGSGRVDLLVEILTEIAKDGGEESSRLGGIIVSGLRGIVSKNRGGLAEPEERLLRPLVAMIRNNDNSGFLDDKIVIEAAAVISSFGVTGMEAVLESLEQVTDTNRYEGEYFPALVSATVAMSGEAAMRRVVETIKVISEAYGSGEIDRDVFAARIYPLIYWSPRNGAVNMVQAVSEKGKVEDATLSALLSSALNMVDIVTDDGGKSDLAADLIILIGECVSELNTRTLEYEGDAVLERALALFEAMPQMTTDQSFAKLLNSVKLSDAGFEKLINSWRSQLSVFGRRGDDRKLDIFARGIVTKDIEQRFRVLEGMIKNEISEMETQEVRGAGGRSEREDRLFVIRSLIAKLGGAVKPSSPERYMTMLLDALLKWGVPEEAQKVCDDMLTGFLADNRSGLPVFRVYVENFEKYLREKTEEQRLSENEIKVLVADLKKRMVEKYIRPFVRSNISANFIVSLDALEFLNADDRSPESEERTKKRRTWIESNLRSITPVISDIFTSYQTEDRYLADFLAGLGSSKMISEYIALLSSDFNRGADNEVFKYVSGKISGAKDSLAYIRGINNMINNHCMTGSDGIDEWRILLEDELPGGERGYVDLYEGFFASRDMVVIHRNIVNRKAFDSPEMSDYKLDKPVAEGGVGLTDLETANRKLRDLAMKVNDDLVSDLNINGDQVRSRIISNMIGLATRFLSATWGHGSARGMDLKNFVEAFGNALEGARQAFLRGQGPSPDLDERISKEGVPRETFECHMLSSFAANAEEAVEIRYFTEIVESAASELKKVARDGPIEASQPPKGAASDYLRRKVNEFIDSLTDILGSEKVKLSMTVFQEISAVEIEISRIQDKLDSLGRELAASSSEEEADATRRMIKQQESSKKQKIQILEKLRAYDGDKGETWIRRQILGVEKEIESLDTAIKAIENEIKEDPSKRKDLAGKLKQLSSQLKQKARNRDNLKDKEDRVVGTVDNLERLKKEMDSLWEEYERLRGQAPPLNIIFPLILEFINKGTLEAKGSVSSGGFRDVLMTAVFINVFEAIPEKLADMMSAIRAGDEIGVINDILYIRGDYLKNHMDLDTGTAERQGTLQRISRLFDVKKLEEAKKRREATDDLTVVTARITRGVLGEMAGDIGDACYTSQTTMTRDYDGSEVMSKSIMMLDRMVGAVIFTSGEQGHARLVGSMLLLKNSVMVNGVPEEVWIIRALNPSPEFIKEHSAEDFIDGAIRYTEKLAAKAGVKHIVAPFNRGVISNRDDVISSIDSFSDETKQVTAIRLNNSEDFNVYDITNECRYVRSKDIEKEDAGSSAEEGSEAGIKVGESEGVVTEPAVSEKGPAADGQAAYAEGIGAFSEELIKGCRNIVIARTSFLQRGNQENWARKAGRKFSKIGVDTMFRSYDTAESLIESIESALAIAVKEEDKDVLIYVNYLLDGEDKGVEKVKAFMEGLPEKQRNFIVLQKDVSASESKVNIDEFNADILKIVSFGTIMLNDKRLSRYAGPEDLVGVRSDLLNFIRECGIVPDFDRILETYFSDGNLFSPGNLDRFMKAMINGDILIRLTPVNYQELVEYNDSMEQVYRSL